MADKLDAWRSTHIAGWHANPEVYHRCVDTNGRHCTGAYELALMIWGRSGISVDLRDAIITHDRAEIVLGDWPTPAKDMMPAMRTMEKAVAIDRGWHVPLNDQDEMRLKFLDALDRYLTVRMVGLEHTADWPDRAEALRIWAENMGVRDRLRGCL